MTKFKLDKNLTKVTIHFDTKEMVSDFYTFIIDNHLSPAVKGNSFGAMVFSGFFSEVDGEKIKEYLKSKNCKQSQILPS